MRYTTIKEQHQINEEIRDREVRVISAEGEQLGIMSAAQALELAEEAELDLVKISPNAVPPVCKIMNYGKFKFEQAKKEKENRKNQKVVELKEIYLSMTIDIGDLNVKAKKTLEILGDGKGSCNGPLGFDTLCLQKHYGSLFCHRQGNGKKYNWTY